MNPTLTILDRARQYLAAIPAAVAGQGGHNQTFTAACALVHGFALGDADAMTLLREWNAKCQPPWSERELEHKIRSAASTTHSKPRGHLLGSGAIPAKVANRYPSLDPIGSKPKIRIDPASAAENYLKKFGSDPIDEADIWEASPIRPPDDWHLDGIALAEALYQPGELINVVVDYKLDRLADGTVKARPGDEGVTMERDAAIAHWRANGMPSSEAGGWWRMNPVDGAGVADANVTAFRFLLLESDELPQALQLRLFARLPVPVAALLTSGSRSIHAWVRMDAATLQEYQERARNVFDLLSRFGIDKQNSNPGRLSRLVGVERKIGATDDGRQRLLYLAPTPNKRILP